MAKYGMPHTLAIHTSSNIAAVMMIVGTIRCAALKPGSSLDRVLKVTLYLADVDDFARVNERYRSFFNAPYPARTTIEAGRLPLGIHVEVDVIAARG